MAPVRSLAVTFIVLLISASAPAASALPVPDHSDQLPADLRAAVLEARRLIAPWFLAAQESVPGTLETVNGTSGADWVELYGAGDANGDGRDDLLLMQGTDADWDAEAEEYVGDWESEARLLSGADLGQSLWSRPAPVNGSLYPVPDLDGDGVADVLVGDEGSGGSFTGESLNLVVGGTGSYSGSVDWTQTLVAGKTGREVGAFDSTFAFASSGAYANALLAGAGQQGFGYDYAYLQPLAPEQLARVGFAWDYQYAYAYPVGGYLADDDEDLTLETLGLDGSVGATRVFAEDARETWDAATADLDGDGTRDFVVVESEDLTHPATLALGTSLARPHIWGVSGDGLTDLWHVEREAGVRYPLAAWSVGDVDGDGSEDLCYIEFLLETPGLVTGDGLHTIMLILSGADGSTLAELDQASEDSFTLAIPYGDVDGDGVAEMLRVDASATGYTVGPVGLDLEPQWSADIGEWEIPANPLFSDYDWSLHGWSDMTGDGVPDLFTVNIEDIVREDEFELDDGGSAGASEEDGPEWTGRLPVRLVSGADGKDAWAQELQDTDGLALLSDLDGDDLQDVFVLHLAGPKADITDRELRNTTISFEVLSGDDGRPVWSQVLRDPVSHPLAGDATSAWVQVRNVGDLGGDGRQEVAVGVEEGRPYVEAEVAEGEPQEYDPDAMDGWIGTPLQTWYIFSSESGRVVGGVVAANPNASGPAGATVVDPSAAGLPAGDFDASDRADSKRAPGLALPVAVLALAALGLARRRAA